MSSSHARVRPSVHPYVRASASHSVRQSVNSSSSPSVPQSICRKLATKKQLNNVDLISQGTRYNHVPLKKVPLRVAKYDVRLREAPLRAVQAMHAILTNMVLFSCNDWCDPVLFVLIADIWAFF